MGRVFEAPRTVTQLGMLGQEDQVISLDDSTAATFSISDIELLEMLANDRQINSELPDDWLMSLIYFGIQAHQLLHFWMILRHFEVARGSLMPMRTTDSFNVTAKEVDHSIFLKLARALYPSITSENLSSSDIALLMLNHWQNYQEFLVPGPADQKMFPTHQHMLDALNLREKVWFDHQGEYSREKKLTRIIHKLNDFPPPVLKRLIESGTMGLEESARLYLTVHQGGQKHKIQVWARLDAVGVIRERGDREVQIIDFKFSKSPDKNSRSGYELTQHLLLSMAGRAFMARPEIIEVDKRKWPQEVKPNFFDIYGPEDLKKAVDSTSLIYLYWNGERFESYDRSITDQDIDLAWENLKSLAAMVNEIGTRNSLMALKKRKKADYLTPRTSIEPWRENFQPLLLITP